VNQDISRTLRLKKKIWLSNGKDLRKLKDKELPLMKKFSTEQEMIMIKTLID